MIGVRILVVEDDPQFSQIVRNLLELEGFEVQVAGNRAEAIKKLETGAYEAILMDLFLSRESGLEILKDLNNRNVTTPVIVMTAHGSIETVSEALRLNAFDYVTKPFGGSAILDIIKRAVEKGRQTVTDISETSGAFPSIIGQSSGMIEVFKAIARVSGTDATVLITGESGTGKELVARAIHDHSVRGRNSFIAVNCGALTETLLESELFGHMKGAFTGAERTHRGIFESASGGTVFLDEISETSPAFQVKLLRVLQERKIRPAGSSDERSVDVRVLAATNRPIDSLLDSPNFRRDLLYRLSVINIHIPPLRDRVEDIPLLAKSFLKKFNRRQNKRVSVPPATMHWIQSQMWPGNVRELENAIERAVTMNRSGQILPEDLKQFGLPAGAGEKLDAEEAGQPQSAETRTRTEAKLEKPQTPSETEEVPGSLDDVTREHILRVLKHTGGNKLRAAEILGVGRWSLYRMAARLGLDLDSLTFESKPRKRRASVKPAAEAPPDDLFDNVNDVVYTRDLSGTITSMNRAGEQLFGVSRSQIVGSSLHELLHDPEVEASLIATNEKLIRDGFDRSIVSVKSPNGRIRFLESNVSIIRDSKGEPSGARGIMRDITEAKELEERLRQNAKELEEANEKLKELNRIKADFTAMLVHDLKTPAASMIMALEYLQKRLERGEDSDIDKMIKAGLASGRTIIQIVEDMLELFRFESTQIELEPAPLAVNEMIRDSFQEASLLASEKGVEMTSTIHPQTPPVNADALKMSRVFSNLFSNALKFTNTGGKIHFEAKAIEGSSVDKGRTFVEFTVADNGEGIAPEHLSYIFDPYWKSERKGVGTGLGLAVVKRIVSAHGGTVSVRSRVGVGSEFHIMLPAVL